MRKIIAVVCMAALATCAYAEVGSVISSFYIGKTTEPTSMFRGIYRDPSYVYAMFEYCSRIYAFTYTPSGARVRDKEVSTLHTHEYLGGITGTHLGSPYIALSATEEYGPWTIYITDPSSGWVVQSFPICGSDVMWDGRYYNVNSGAGVYKRYTTAGATAGQWTVAGWPTGLSAGASTCGPRFNYATGRYLFVVSNSVDSHYVFDINDGSLLASWPTPPNICYGQSYGDAYPASYGGALWYHGYIWQENDAHWAFQIDVNARDASSVVPASVGKIKAIYR